MAETCYLALPTTGPPFSGVLRAAANAATLAGLEPVWVERTADHGEYWPRLRAQVAQAAVVVVDFSDIVSAAGVPLGPDPNVITEAALARFAEHSFLLVLRADDKQLPADWTSVRPMSYRSDAEGLIRLQQRLAKELRLALVALYKERGETPPEVAASRVAELPPPIPSSEELIPMEMPALDPLPRSDPALKPLMLAAPPTMLLTLTGHVGGIRHGSAATELPVVVTGGDDSTVRIWELTRGACAHILTGHTQAPSVVAIERKGRRALSAGPDMIFRVWDLAAGRQENWGRAPAGFTQVAILPARTADPRGLLALGDGRLQRWNLRQGTTLDSWLAHDGPITGLAITLDGRQALTAGADQALRLWDISNGRELLGINNAHAAPILAVAIDSDGTFAVSAGLDHTKLWALASGEELSLLQEHEGPATAAAFLPGTDLVITTGRDGCAALWNITERQLVTVWTAHASAITAVSALTSKASGTERASRAVTFGEDGRIVYWDLTPCLL